MKVDSAEWSSSLACRSPAFWQCSQPVRWRPSKNGTLVKSALRVGAMLAKSDVANADMIFSKSQSQSCTFFAFFSYSRWEEPGRYQVEGLALKNPFCQVTT